MAWDRSPGKSNGIPAFAAHMLPLKAFYTHKTSSACIPGLWQYVSPNLVGRGIEQRLCYQAGGDGRRCLCYLMHRWAGEISPGAGQRSHCPTGPSPAPHAAGDAATAPGGISHLRSLAAGTLPIFGGLNSHIHLNAKALPKPCEAQIQVCKPLQQANCLGLLKERTVSGIRLGSPLYWGTIYPVPQESEAGAAPGFQQLLSCLPAAAARLRCGTEGPGNLPSAPPAAPAGLDARQLVGLFLHCKVTQQPLLCPQGKGNLSFPYSTPMDFENLQIFLKLVQKPRGSTEVP